MRTDNAAR
jgi:hypothetical protein